MNKGDEGNAIPYWAAARHVTLNYISGGKPRSFETRVLISWGKDWYLIHLSEFKASAPVGKQ